MFGGPDKHYGGVWEDQEFKTSLGYIVRNNERISHISDALLTKDTEMKGRGFWALFSEYHIHIKEWYSKKGKGLEEN